jgi:hypothetical protein
MLTGNANVEVTVRKAPKRGGDWEILLMIMRIKVLGFLETSENTDQST